MISISVEGVSPLWKLRFLWDGTTCGYIGENSVRLSSLAPCSPFSFSLSPALARDRYYFQAAQRGLPKARGWTLAGGGSGVLQREIPSITPWASYIRDYFSFLSSLPLSLSLIPSLAPAPFSLFYLTFFSRHSFLARLTFRR